MDNKQTPEESLGQASEEIEKAKEKNPFGENIKPAMYILFDQVKGNFFVVGAPGFLDDMARAYGALKIAEKNLDEFYSRKASFRENIIKGVRDFNARMNFRNFFRGKR